MTTYQEVNLKKSIQENGQITVTIVDGDEQVSEKTFTDFDEAKNEIQILENTNTVYF